MKRTKILMGSAFAVAISFSLMSNSFKPANNAEWFDPNHASACTQFESPCGGGMVTCTTAGTSPVYNLNSSCATAKKKS